MLVLVLVLVLVPLLLAAAAGIDGGVAAAPCSVDDDGTNGGDDYC